MRKTKPILMLDPDGVPTIPGDDIRDLVSGYCVTISSMLDPFDNSLFNQSVISEQGKDLMIDLNCVLTPAQTCHMLKSITKLYSPSMISLTTFTPQLEALTMSNETLPMIVSEPIPYYLTREDLVSSGYGEWDNIESLSYYKATMDVEHGVDALKLPHETINYYGTKAFRNVSLIATGISDPGDYHNISGLVDYVLLENLSVDLQDYLRKQENRK